jgi:hypothetical protein
MTGPLQAKFRTMNSVRTAMSAAVIALAAWAPWVAAQPTSCQPTEVTWFSCSTGSKQIAVCAPRDASAPGAQVQYRFGLPQRAEIVLQPGAQIRAGSLMFSRGGGATLRFPNAGTDYIVYTAISGQWGEKSGVAIERSGTLIHAVKCRGAIVTLLGPDLFDTAGLKRDEADFLLPE